MRAFCWVSRVINYWPISACASRVTRKNFHACFRKKPSMSVIGSKKFVGKIRTHLLFAPLNFRAPGTTGVHVIVESEFMHCTKIRLKNGIVYTCKRCINRYNMVFKALFHNMFGLHNCWSMSKCATSDALWTKRLSLNGNQRVKSRFRFALFFIWCRNLSGSELSVKNSEYGVTILIFPLRFRLL